MNFSQLPNILTVIRIVMVIPIIFTIIQEYYLATLILFVIAGVTDMLDGFIARQWGFESNIGSILDPLADKVLLISVFFMLYVVALIPGWFLFIVLLRDVMIVSGVVVFYLSAEDKTPLKPSIISKINTFVQITLAIYIIATQVFISVDGFVMQAIIITATTTIVSGSDYVWAWLKRYNEITSSCKR